MRFVCWLLLLITGRALAMNHADLGKLVQSAPWPAYASALQHYQSVSPGAFSPLELLRLDRLDYRALQEQVTIVGGEWTRLEAKTRDRANREARESLSRKANEWLLTQFRQGRVSPNGAHLTILKALKETQRFALTPLDALFQKTEIGKKVAGDLKARSEFEVRAVGFDRDAQTIVFEGIPVAWARNAKAPALPIYSIAVSELGDGETVKIRGKFVDRGDAAYPDLKFRREYLSGSFFDPKGASRYLLGPMPATKNVFIDEGGTSHFSGDGHKH